MTEEQKKLVEDNMDFAISKAKIWHSKLRFIDVDELISIANDALVRAVISFDESKNTKFTTFAYIYIDNYIKNYIFKEVRQSRIVEQQIEVAKRNLEASNYNLTEDLKVVMMCLSDEDRFIIEKFYIENRTVENLALMLNITSKELNKKISKARSNLRKEYFK